jgi:hypothetical protein
VWALIPVVIDVSGEDENFCLKQVKRVTPGVESADGGPDASDPSDPSSSLTAVNSYGGRRVDGTRSVDADDGGVEMRAAVGPEVGGVPVGEDPAVGGGQPIALAAWRSLDADDGGV